MRPIRTLARLTVVLTCAAAPLAAGTAAAPAANAGARPHHATFRGPMSGNHRSGVAGDNVTTVKVESGTCAETGASALGSCNVTWSIDRDICKVVPQDPPVAVGTASYTNSFGHTYDFELFGGAEAGSGILEGYVPLAGGVAHIHIDASDVCGAFALVDLLVGAQAAVAASQFTGYVDFVYVNATVG